ncbi:hypothetical protein F0562_030431 [Nyssa sinensis]|uniref:Uncharacterized protein n=1 Tax=Nyssa sinensis TaxID=561372 RepID=A0A5J5AYU6_9ASTE|nr:hypothetical protein F0562_030431 [Nyssa sinensis]
MPRSKTRAVSECWANVVEVAMMEALAGQKVVELAIAWAFPKVDVVMLVVSFLASSYVFVPRSGYIVAHKVARFALCNGLDVTWEDCFPPWLQHLVT